MNNYKVTLSAKDGITPEITKAKKSLDELGKTASSQSDKIEKQFEKITQSSAPLQTQLKGLKKLLAEMEFNGMAGTEQFTRIAAEAGAMSDAIQDASDAVKKFSSDTQVLDAVMSGFQGVTSAISIGTGAMGLFGVKSEQVQQAMLKVQSALTLLNGVQQLSNVLNKNSAVIQGIKRLQLKLTTAATVKDTAATTANTAAVKSATIAQRAFNVVAKANPYVLLATAIAAATTALFAFGDSAEDATEKLGKLEDGSNDLMTTMGRQAEYNENLKNKAAELIGEYDKLRIQFLACGDDAEKQNKFIQSLGDNFFVLGTRVNNSTSAIEMFVKKAPEVRKAYMYIASIEAAQNVYKKMMEQSLGNMLQNLPPIDYASMSTQFRTEYNSEGGMVIPKNLRDMGFGQNDLKLKYDNLGGHWSFTNEAALKKYNDMMEKSAKDAIARMAKGFNDTQEYAGKYLEDFIQGQIKAFDNLGLGSYQDYIYGQSGKNKLPPPPKPETTTTPKPDKPSQPKMTTVKASQAKKDVEKQLTELQELEKKRAELETYLKRGDLTDLERFNKEEELKKLDEEISFIKNWTRERTYVLSLPDDAFVFDYNGALDNALKDFQKNLQSTLDNADIVGVVPVDVQTLLKPLEKSQIAVYDNAKSSANQIKQWFDDGLISIESAQEKLAVINAQLQMLGLEPIKIDLDTSDFKRKAAEAANTVNQLSSSISSAFAAMNDLYKADNKEDNRALMVGKIVAQAVATLSLSFAQSMKGSMTVWDWIAGGISGMATLISMIAQIKSATSGYAEGGIIGGNSFRGDRMIARVNSGEMILNHRQQANMFKMINSGFSTNGVTGNTSITMKVRGADIYASLKNYGKLNKVKTI